MLVLEARQVDVALRMAMPSDLLVPAGPAPAVTLRRRIEVEGTGRVQRGGQEHASQAALPVL
jgi:hypothetical protein